MKNRLSGIQGTREQEFWADLQEYPDRLERVIDTVADDTSIVAAPDCGFGTQAGLGMVSPEIAWAKLEALVDGAEIASERVY